MTTGDKVQDRPLSEIGGKGLFVKEIEEALLDGRADFAVHSIKDVPAELPTGLSIACIPVREDPRDVLVSPRHGTLAALPHGARVGTSSLRRAVALKVARPDLDCVPVRGNVDTRLRKVDAGEYDAIVLARAGLVRLELEGRATEILSTDVSLPAVGQGALGIECRDVDAAVRTWRSRPFTMQRRATCVAAEARGVPFAPSAVTARRRSRRTPCERRRRCTSARSSPRPMAQTFDEGSGSSRGPPRSGRPSGSATSSVGSSCDERHRTSGRDFVDRPRALLACRDPAHAPNAKPMPDATVHAICVSESGGDTATIQVWRESDGTFVVNELSNPTHDAPLVFFDDDGRGTMRILGSLRHAVLTRGARGRTSPRSRHARRREGREDPLQGEVSTPPFVE